MGSTAQWIDSFLMKRGFEKPTGEPLYSYYISEADFNALTKILSIPFEDDDLWAACFVLYASEWWRCNYDGGHQIWEPILEEIGKLDSIDPPKRNQIVIKGLKFWERSVFKSTLNNSYLGTIALESGIPVKLLEKNKHYITELITRIYYDLGSISSMEEEYLIFIENKATQIEIPVSLRQDDFFCLIGDIVLSLANLKENYDLSNQENPVDYLNVKNPNWRGLFPIRVDSAEAIKFIDNLLSDVANIPPPVTNSAVVKYSLEQIQGKWFCISYLSINSGLHRFERMGLIEEEFIRLSSKLELFRTNGETEIPIGYVFNVPEKKSIRIDELGDIQLTKYALQNQNWSLFLLDPQTGETFDISISNINLSITEEPLIFAKKNNRFELLGCGTVRTKADLVRILVNQNAKVECENLKEIGGLDNEILLFEASSSCRVIIEKSIFQVALNSEEDLTRYELRPNDNSNRFYLLPRLNKNIFIGFPRVYQIKAETGRISRVISGLEYYNNNEWQKVGNSIFGFIRVRLKKDNETHFVKTISVLPPDFSLDFKVSKKEAFYVKTESKLKLIVNSDIPSEIQESDSKTKVVVFDTSKISEEDLPETFVLNLTKQGFYRQVSITLPFPREKIAIYNKRSERLTNDNYLYSNDVYGARLSLSNLIDQSQRYRVLLTLENAFNATGIQLNRVIELEPYQHRSIPLIIFQHQWDRLFSLTENIDAYVQLRVGHNQIRISQFPNIRPTVDGNQVSISGDYQDGGIKISALPLDKPFKQENIVTLRYLEEKKWKWPEIEGVWMFFPSKDSVQFFRPIAHIEMFKDTIDLSMDLKEMHQASILPRDERLIALSRVARIMFDNPNHPDWKRLMYLYNSTSHIPLSTFDNWTVIEKNAKTLLLGCFMFTKEIIDRLTKEYSIIWQEYPLDNWIEVFEKYQTYVREEFGGHSDDIIETKLDLITNLLGLYAHKEILTGKTQPINGKLIRGLIEEELNGKEGQAGLRARHQNETWPDKFNKAIIEIVNQLPEFIHEILPRQIPDSQKGIVYLPFVLAAAANSKTQADIHQDDVVNRFKMLEMIEFDKEWFDVAYDLLLGFIWSKIHKYH